MPQQLEINVTYDPRPLHAQCPTQYQRIVPQLPHLPTDKFNRHVHLPTRQVNKAVASFSHVHVDMVGPLPLINNSPTRYIVTFIDSSTNWIEAHPVHSSRSSFRIEFKTGQQSHISVSSHSRTRCTIPDNSSRKAAAPITLAFVKTLQDNLKHLAFTKDIRQISTQNTFIQRALDNCNVV